MIGHGFWEADMEEDWRDGFDGWLRKRSTDFDLALEAGDFGRGLGVLEGLRDAVGKEASRDVLTLNSLRLLKAAMEGGDARVSAAAGRMLSSVRNAGEGGVFAPDMPLNMAFEVALSLVGAACARGRVEFAAEVLCALGMDGGSAAQVETVVMAGGFGHSEGWPDSFEGIARLAAGDNPPGLFFSAVRLLSSGRQRREQSSKRGSEAADWMGMALGRLEALTLDKSTGKAAGGKAEPVRM